MPIWEDVDLVYPVPQRDEVDLLQARDGSLQSEISSADYPTYALRNELSGVVRALVGFGRDGQLASCRPLTSSGSAYLDNQTCSAIMLRTHFQFTPAAAAYSGLRYYVAAVRWVLPT